MAQYIKSSDTQDGEQRYEVMMLAAGKDGSVVEATNPLPVTLGSENVNITGPVTIPGTVEINNDSGNPIPVSRNTTVNSSSNPLYISGQVQSTSSSAAGESAFGELSTIQIVPKIQGDAVYGLDPREFQTFTFANGTATNSNSRFNVTATSDANSYGVIRSTNFLRYKPGQGALCRLTASFSSNPVGFTQRAGLFNQENAIQIGYDSVTGNFGVLRANGGKTHIEEFSFSALNNGDVTVTLNGTTFTAITLSGGTIAANLAQLSAGLRLQAAFTARYTEEYDQAKISFLPTSLGLQSGTFNMTSTATITFTKTTKQTGVAQTENWTFQNDFSVDKLDGTGASGVTLDPTKLNVYQINFRWLGAGEIRYAVEDPNTGNMIFFHHEHYTNRFETPHLDNPSMKIGYVAANLGAVSGSVSCRGASFMGANEGKVQPTRVPYSVTATRTGSMNVPGSFYHLISLKNKLIYQGKINTRDLLPRRLTASVNTTGDPAIIRLFFNPTFANNMQWLTQTDFNASLYATQDSTGVFILGSQAIPPVAAFHVSNGDTIDVDLLNLSIDVPPNNILTAVITSTSNITQASSSFIYVED